MVQGIRSDKFLVLVSIWYSIRDYLQLLCPSWVSDHRLYLKKTRWSQWHHCNNERHNKFTCNRQIHIYLHPRTIQTTDKNQAIHTHPHELYIFLTLCVHKYSNWNPLCISILGILSNKSIYLFAHYAIINKSYI